MIIIIIINNIKGIAKISKKSFIDDKLWKMSHVYNNLFAVCVVVEICELVISNIVFWACDIIICINGLLLYVWFICCNLDNPMLVACTVNSIDADAMVGIKYEHISMSIKDIKIPTIRSISRPIIVYKLL